MNFLKLKIGSKFVIVRENNPELVYVKTKDTRHLNATYNNHEISIHGNTIVKEIKK